MLRTFLQTRNYVRRAGNPGLNKLAKTLKDVQEIVDDPEGFGDIESDFMEVHKSHKQHERELQHRQQQIQHFIVGNKYFKIRQPNFLTYGEKEQIKLLYSRDPDEWNAEKLSESFPATQEIIEKVLKAKWTAMTSHRIEQHDKGVMRNWKMFNDGQWSEIDPNLEQHLKKFAKRTEKDLQNSTNTAARSRLEPPKPKRTEFSSIITESMKFRKTAAEKQADDDSARMKQISTSSETTRSLLIEPARPPPPVSGTQSMEEETYLAGEIHNRRPMRFRDLRPQLEDDGSSVEQDERAVALHQVENPQGTGVVQLGHGSRRSGELAVNKFAVNEVEISSRDMISLSSGIRERIHIPRRLWKRGYTYKLKDCYYDDDGELLYRVPGMTGRTVSNQ